MNVLYYVLAIFLLLLIFFEYLCIIVFVSCCIFIEKIEKNIMCLKINKIKIKDMK